MKRKVFAFLLCLILVMAMPITARADIGPKPSVRIEFTGIQGETYYGTLLSLRDSTGPAYLSEEEQSVIISKTNLEVVQDDSVKGGIQCFDVNQNGIYALAFGTGSNCRVYVYDPNGVFLYGYRFYSDGDYAIGFHEDTLAIYSLRGNTIALYDAAGVCISVQRVAITNQSYIDIKEMLDRTVKDMGGRLYVLERDLDIGDSYSRFVTISESGERTVLYDISSEHTLGQSVFFITIVGFFLLVIQGICRKRSSMGDI